MVNWLNKKTRPAVTELEASQLEELSTNGKINIVFHGDIASHEHGNLFKELATADDYNSIFTFIKPITASKELNKLPEQSKSSDLLESQSALKLIVTLRAGSQTTKDQSSSPSMTELLVTSSERDALESSSSNQPKQVRLWMTLSLKLLRRSELSKENLSSLPASK